MGAIALRIVKLVLSAWWLLGTRLLGRGGGVVVLYYHDVPSDQRAQFARQLDLLQRSSSPVDPISLAIPPRGGGVAITFDDGLVSFVENGLPELVKRGIPSAVFVPSGYLGEPPSWVTDGRYDLETERVMTADELRALPAELVRIGSHTVSHADLTRLSAADLRRELAGSREKLEDIVGRPVTTLSFPFGAHSVDVIEACRRAGYTRLYTTTPRALPRAGAGLLVDRTAVEPSDWPLELRLKAVGGYGWIPWYGKLKARLRRARADTGRSEPETSGRALR